MLKLHFRLVKIRTISICCDSFEAYKWLQMKLENKCKISTHFFSRMVKRQSTWCMPNKRILLSSRYWCTSLPITLHLFIIELLSVCIWARHSRNTFDLTSIYWHSKIMKTKAGSFSSYCMKVIPIYFAGEQVLLSVNLFISFHVLNSLLHLQVVWMWFYQKYNQSKSLIWSTISGQQVYHKDISAQDTEATRLPFCCFRLIQKCVQI